MNIFTSVILGIFGVYAAGCVFGAFDGSFENILFIATFLSGAYWIAEKIHFLPKRREAAAVAVLKGEDEKKALAQPWWLDWTAGLFVVILGVFMVRSFLVEPFKVPSGSMIPTLQIGDMILVNKFSYGIKLPIINTTIVDIGSPQRGDVVVFKYPPKPSVNYIKRLVGMPGDKISYLNKRLVINGKEVDVSELPEFTDKSTNVVFKQYDEVFDGQHHLMINDISKPSKIENPDEFAGKDACEYVKEGVTCTVPYGLYFMVGDNRDNSVDSRYWGFVPERNVIGKAFFILMNVTNPSRIGTFK